MQASNGLNLRFFKGVGNSGWGRHRTQGSARDSRASGRPTRCLRQTTWCRTGAVVGQRAVRVPVDGGAEGPLARHDEAGPPGRAGGALLLQRLLQPPLGKKNKIIFTDRISKLYRTSMTLHETPMILQRPIKRLFILEK